MPHLISYDISSDRLRNKVAKKLTAAGFIRFQKSVFIENKLPGHVVQKVKNWVKNNLTFPPESPDKLIILYFTEEQLKALQIDGVISAEMDEILYPKNTLII